MTTYRARRAARAHPWFVVARVAFLVSLLIALGTISCRASDEYPDPPATSYSVANFTLESPGGQQTLTGANVSEDFFRTANVRVMLGRLFTPADYEGTPAHVAVLSKDLWKTGFKSDPAVIGRTIRLNGQDVVVVGVLPDNFVKPSGAKVWLPRPRSK